MPWPLSGAHSRRAPAPSTPLLTPPSPLAQRWALRLWLLGLVLSALLAWAVHAANQRLLASRLAALGDEVALLVSQRFNIYEYGLRAARGAVVAAGGSAVSREVFAAYMATRDMAQEFPGARGFGFIRRVARSEEANFLAAARAEGPVSFSIRELEPHDGERFVIQYIYPLAPNQGATGLDVASEANRREAALAAARSGQARLTAPVTLVQAGEQPRRGFLAFLPVYRAGAATHTPEARLAATLGWTYAPLVVDEVLAQLGPRMHKIELRLTDLDEPEPFYLSPVPTADAARVGKLPVLEREITVHGRQWRLQVRALPALAEAARPTPPAAVAGMAATVATLLAALVWLLLRARPSQGLVSAADQPSPVSLGAFVRSPLLVWAVALYVPFVTISLVLGWRTEWERQVRTAGDKLVSLVDERAVRLRGAQLTRLKNLLFLAETPPVQGLSRTLPGRIDPMDGSWRETWEMRLEQLLAAHMKASPEVYRARFVAIDEGGHELVRVDRLGGSPVAAPVGELRSLADHPDVRQAAALPSGEAWVSNLDLNPEPGAQGEPPRPTFRYATPVHRSDGRLFGVLMLHVDVAERLSDAAARAPAGGAVYIVNAAGEFLLHPDRTRSFQAAEGRTPRWDDEFQPAAAPRWQPVRHPRLTLWRGPDGLLITATAMVSPNPNSDIGTMRYVDALPMAQVSAAAASELRSGLALPLAGAVAGLLLLYLYWAGEQRRLQAQAQRLRLATIVDQSQDAIIGLDAAQLVTAWNRGAHELFGIDANSAIGRPLMPLIGAASAVPDTEAAERTLEFDCRHHDGRHLRVAMTLTRLDDGAADAASALLRDVTEERASQQRIVELNQSLQEQLRERSEMLDVLAHEVRQPLHNASAALQSASGVVGPALGDASPALIQRAQAVLADVQCSLDNTLAAAALLARPGPLHASDADLDALLSVAIADMPAAERGRVVIRRETRTRTALMDPSLMRLALRNLLSNALKFSPAGSTVTVRIADSDAPLAVLIDVTDSGPGVPEALRERLFTRGARGTSERSGHGLGLYIVQQVMAVHQGSVELLHSGPGGATFRLTLIQELPEP